MQHSIKAAGAVPVSIMLPALYENFQRGVVDGGPLGLDLMVQYKFYEVAKHVTMVKMWQGITAPVYINLGKWNAISPEDQKVMLNLAKEAEKKEIAMLAEVDAELRKTMKEKGVELVELSESELQKWIDASPDLFSDWVGRMEKIGKGEDARRTVAIWKELSKTGQ